MGRTHRADLSNSLKRRVRLEFETHQIKQKSAKPAPPNLWVFGGAGRVDLPCQRIFSSPDLSTTLSWLSSDGFGCCVDFIASMAFLRDWICSKSSILSPSISWILGTTGAQNGLIFNPAKSKKLIHWNHTGDCCQWKGVACSTKGNPKERSGAMLCLPYKVYKF
ncbi:hypothetical protein Ahy_B02g061277 [Arachis hypogaea]|uniref:Leucine-rich repeat-containing N-terminal plant-type domain-containing protein n=1 Tax=Arachis hypogaea TaxID=3818 RepID=A0A445AKI4_ARAHY|nr:hypothetical protein Ahy_B02g061277 [Arachis hypogaea]